MTPRVIHDRAEYEQATREMEAKRKEFAAAYCRAFPHRAHPDLSGASYRAYPLPVLAPQVVRGKSGKLFRQAPNGITEHESDDLACPVGYVFHYVVPGDEPAFALVLLQAEGLADLVVRALGNRLGWMEPQDLKAQIVAAYPALCKQAGAP